jgi:hypothetical protein
MLIKKKKCNRESGAVQQKQTSFQYEQTPDLNLVSWVFTIGWVSHPFKGLMILASFRLRQRSRSILGTSRSA